MVKRGTLLCVTVKIEKSITLLMLELNLKKKNLKKRKNTFVFFFSFFLKRWHPGAAHLAVKSAKQKHCVKNTYYYCKNGNMCSNITWCQKKEKKNNNNKAQTHQIPKGNELWLSNEELQDASRLVYCEQTAGGFEIAFWPECNQNQLKRNSFEP